MAMVHVVFFPMMAQGHMLPILDMARLFASRGVKATIITTPLNASVFSKTIERAKQSGFEIGLQLINFQAVAAGSPENCENLEQVTSDEMLAKFLKATAMLQEQLEEKDLRPNCLIADMYFPWATDSAAKFEIPRLVFYGTCYFPLCASESIGLYKPFNGVSSDSEPIVLPNLPHEVKLTRRQVGPHGPEEGETESSKLLNQVKESELSSYGVLGNSFYELEPEYADHYRKLLGRRAWHIGPVSLCNVDLEDKGQRGKEASIDEHYCLNWLDSKKPNSVIYVCFGSMANLTGAQLYEVAMGLEASGHPFIWVVRIDKDDEEMTKWLPKGYEARIKGKGLIVRGWAPQVLILDHEAVGGFVTHCGWNSTLEGVCAGVPTVTWPLFAEQFLNEKLVTEILRIGVEVGVDEWVRFMHEGVKRDAIEKAVKRVMVGEEAEQMRSRAKALKEMAKKAVEDGGSSYSNLNNLIGELKEKGPK